MNSFDIIILVVLLFFAIKGLTRGLVNEVSSLAGLLLGGWLAYRYYPAFSVPIRNALPIPQHFSAFLAFMLILLLTGICAHIAGNILTGALKLVMLGTVNRLGGLLIGTAEGCLLLCMLFYIATLGFMPAQLKANIMSSGAAGSFASAGGVILSSWKGETTGKRP